MKQKKIFLKKKIQNGWFFKLSVFQNLQFSKFFRKNFTDWYLQPKNTKNAFFTSFCPYVRQPHDHISWATSMPFASINPCPVDTGQSNLATMGTLLEHLIWYMMTWCTSHFFYYCVTLLICLVMKVTRLKKTNRAEYMSWLMWSRG